MVVTTTKYRRPAGDLHNWLIVSVYHASPGARSIPKLRMISARCCLSQQRLGSGTAAWQCISSPALNFLTDTLLFCCSGGAVGLSQVSGGWSFTHFFSVMIGTWQLFHRTTSSSTQFHLPHRCRYHAEGHRLAMCAIASRLSEIGAVRAINLHQLIVPNCKWLNNISSSLSTCWSAGFRPRPFM